MGRPPRITEPGLADELSSRPQQWMPWNYREAFEPTGTTTDAPGG